MKLKRIIAIACTAAMTVSLISGCGGASDKGQKEAVNLISAPLSRSAYRGLWAQVHGTR